MEGNKFFGYGKPTKVSMAIDAIDFIADSNIIPNAWFEYITFDNGKPDVNAILILSDIVYWYRSITIRDELTGRTKKSRKFRGDMLQKSCGDAGLRFNLSRKQATEALVRLENLGLIHRELRTIKINGIPIPNTQFISPVPEAVKKITHPDVINHNNKAKQESVDSEGARYDVEVHTSVRGSIDVYDSDVQLQKNTTENTTEASDKSKDLSHRFPEVASLSSENDSSSFRCSTPNGISDNDSYNHNNSVESEVKTEIEEKNNVAGSTTTENKNPVSSATQHTRELTIEEEIEREEKENAELPVPWDNSASVVRRAKASVSESNESPRSGVVGGLSEKETHSKQSTSTQKEQRSQEKNEVHIPEKVKPYLEVWRAAGLHVPGENTKRFEQSIESLKKLISGRVFQQTEFSHLARPYSLDDWTKAVWNFQTAAIDPSYYPSNKKPLLSMTPNEFIYNPFNKQQRSCFVYYYSNSPQSITPLYKDDHPEMTNLLIRCYRVDILKGAVQDLSVNDKNKFMLLAKKVEEFFRSNQKNLTNGLGQNREKKAKAVWECAMEYFANDPTRLSPHMLLGEWFIKDALPKFLIKNGYFRQSSLLSPFKSNPYKL